MAASRVTAIDGLYPDRRPATDDTLNKKLLPVQFCSPAIIWLSTRQNIQNLGQNIQFCYLSMDFGANVWNSSLGLFPHDSDFWRLEISVALFGVHDLCCPRQPLWARARGMVEPAVAIFSLSSQ